MGKLSQKNYKEKNLKKLHKVKQLEKRLKVHPNDINSRKKLETLR